MNCWEGVAKTTGGAIKTNKSWWYLLHYVWDSRGDWTYGSLDNIENNVLTSNTATNVVEPLEYLDPDEGKKMLGVYLTPNGSNEIQIKKMEEKIINMIEHVRTGHLQRHEAWIALTTMTLKSLEYALPALTLTEEE